MLLQVHLSHTRFSPSLFHEQFINLVNSRCFSLCLFPTFPIKYYIGLKNQRSAIILVQYTIFFSLFFGLKFFPRFFRQIFKIMRYLLANAFSCKCAYNFQSIVLDSLIWLTYHIQLYTCFPLWLFIRSNMFPIIAFFRCYMFSIITYYLVQHVFHYDICSVLHDSTIAFLFGTTCFPL